MKDENAALELLGSIHELIENVTKEIQAYSVGSFQRSFDRPQKEKALLQKRALLWSRLTCALSDVTLLIAEIQLENGICLEGIEITATSAAKSDEGESK